MIAEQYVEEVKREALVETKIEWTPERIKLEYKRQAERYGASFEQMWATVKCENSALDPHLQSYHVKNGVREESYGISQIHLPSWPDVTKEEATNPAFSAEFMAKKFSEGSAYLWSCYNMIY